MLTSKYISQLHFASKISYLFLCCRFQFVYVIILCTIKRYYNLYFSKKNIIWTQFWFWSRFEDSLIGLQDKLIWEDKIGYRNTSWNVINDTKGNIINSMFPWKWTVNIQCLKDIVHLQFSALPPKTRFLCHYKHSCYLSSATAKKKKNLIGS